MNERRQAWIAVVAHNRRPTKGPSVRKLKQRGARRRFKAVLRDWTTGGRKP